ncbi:unnamed protein product [Gordionus sp. m RMFG-2023]
MAPMVRFGTLPSRLTALDYGADLVFAEEIVDRLILKSKFVLNHKLKTIDFIVKENEFHKVDKNSNIVENIAYKHNFIAENNTVFRTPPLKENNKLIFQLGTRNIENAIKISQYLSGVNWKSEFNVPNDDDSSPYIISGIDLNMGCPKDYSLKAGIGSALLRSDTEIELACRILEALVKENRPKDIKTSCKIRVLPTLPDTLRLCQTLQKTGIDALTIHGRTPSEKKSDFSTPNRDHYINEISRLLNDSCTIIANGGSNCINKILDIDYFKAETGCNSIMLARSAMKNLSIFSTSMVTRDEVIRKYLKYALIYENEFINSKYAIQQMFYHDGKSDQFQKLLKAKNYREMCKIWKPDTELFIDIADDIYSDSFESHKNNIDVAKFDNVDGIIIMDLHYDYREWPNMQIDNNYRLQFNKFPNPKLALIHFCNILNIPQPSYYSISSPDNRTFKGIVDIKDLQFSTYKWEKSKKIAEQSSALCAIKYISKFLSL